MPKEHFQYDADQLVLRFNDRASVQLLRGFLIRGKLGDYLDPLLVLNHILATLITSLKEDVPDISSGGALPAARFNRDFLCQLGGIVAEQAGPIGWWKMSNTERLAYINDVVAAPHRFRDEDVEVILDAIDSTISRAKRIVESIPSEN